MAATGPPGRPKREKQASATRAAPTRPPSAPSIVLFGLRCGASLCLPIERPTR